MSPKQKLLHQYLPPDGFPVDPQLSVNAQIRSAQNKNALDGELFQIISEIQQQTNNQHMMPDDATEKVAAVLARGANPNSFHPPFNAAFHMCITLGNDQKRRAGGGFSFAGSMSPADLLRDFQSRQALSVQLIKIFQSHKVNPNLVDPCQNAPLATAIMMNCGFDVVKALIDGGTFVDFMDVRCGHRPLHSISVSSNQWPDGNKILEYFVKECRAGVNQCDKQGMSPMHFAVNGMNFFAVKYLVEEGGADVMVQNNKKQTPLIFAMEKLVGFKTARIADKIAQGEQIIAFLEKKEAEARENKIMLEEKEEGNDIENNGNQDDDDDDLSVPSRKRRIVMKTDNEKQKATRKGKKETDNIGTGK